MKKKLYKTIVTFEVLSSEPISGDATIDDLLYECDNGECSGYFPAAEMNIELEGEDAVNEVKKHGTDAEFFLMDENGNCLEDYDDLYWEKVFGL